MSIAFNILAHKEPEQLIRLVNALRPDNNLILIHWDSRASDSEFHDLKQRLQSENVLFQKRNPIHWGGRKMLQTQLEGIKALSEKSDEWTHYINLSGQDFPIKSHDEITEFLNQNTDHSFIDSFDPDVTKNWKNHPDRVTKYFIESSLLKLILKTPFFGRKIRKLMDWERQLPNWPILRKKYPFSFKLMGGSNFVILNSEACKAATESEQARIVAKCLKNSLLPEESYFQSVLLNSPLESKIVNDNKRFILWDKDFAHPKTILEEHLEEMLNSGCFYARKFDRAESRKAISQLEIAMAAEVRY